MFIQILLFAAALILTVWILGVGLASVFHPDVKPLGGNILLGIPLLALTVWLPFAFGWVGA